MSETTEGTPPSEPQPAPPESTPAPDTETPEQTPEEQRAARDKGDRRFAVLSAKLDAAERRDAQREAELEFYRRQAQQQPQHPGVPETLEQTVARVRAEERASAINQVMTERFHEEGSSEYGDWKQRCDDLIKMGADSEFARLLVETPGGVKIAAALAEDPEAVQRIARIQSERGRAVELGKYAATIAGNGATPREAAAPAVTRAPAPIRPVTGRAAPTFNEYSADGQSLVDRYMKQNLDRQVRR